MPQLMLINPRTRKHARKAAPHRPKRARRNPHAMTMHRRKRARRNPISAHNMSRVHRRRTRRNPVGGTGMGAQLMHGFVSGAGAVVVDVIQGFIPLPASLATGYGPYIVKGAIGLLLGTVGRKVMGKTAATMGAGAVTVAAYGALKQMTAGMLPGSAAVAGMGYMSPVPQVMSGMGEYINGPGARMAGVGEYIPETLVSAGGPGFH